MNNGNTHLVSLFTPSGCLTGDALFQFVSGMLKDAEVAKANQHIAECPLCADAADGLRMWLNKNSSAGETPEALDYPARELTVKQSFEHSHKSKSEGTKPNLFQARTNALNYRIRQRLHKQVLAEAENGKSFSYKPFVWLAAAATIVLFIGGFYVLWMQNQSENMKLAQKLEMESSMGFDKYDTLPFPPSESKSVLTISYNRRKGVQSPPVLAIVTEEAGRAASNDVLVKSSATDDVEFSEYRHMKKSDSREDESNASKEYRTNTVPYATHGGAAMKKEETSDESETVLTYVKEMPSFPGGDSERLKFLSKNIRYPQQAAENGIQGPVYVSFVVKKDGSLADIKILKGIGGGCDEEAVRVVKKMPRWNAGYQNGKKVSVLFNMKINFRLQ